jgi:hypothetical protein
LVSGTSGAVGAQHRDGARRKVGHLDIFAADAIVGSGALSADRRFVIEVADSSTELPISGDAGPFEVHGRGLVIVEALADAWGAQLTDHTRGKVVWAASGEAPRP